MNPQGSNSQAGSTLIGTIVAVGIFGVVAALAATGLSKMMGARKSSAVATSYQEIDGSLQSSLSQALINSIAGGGSCGSTGLTFDRAIGAYGHRFQRVTSMAALPTSAPQEHVDGQGRCSHSVRLPPSATDFYFCLALIRPDTPAPLDSSSFLMSRYAFAEVNAKFVDFATGLDVPCDSVRTAIIAGRTKPRAEGTSGLLVRYSVYWSAQTGEGLAKRHNGAFYVPAN